MVYSIAKVLDGISKKIFSVFGDDYNISTDDIPQNFEKPAFFIKVLNDNEKHYRGKRYSSNKSFVIYGFSENDSEEELYEMGENLYNLEYIELEDGSLLRGINRSFRVENKTLIFLIDYNTFVYKKGIEDEKMQTIYINEEVKNE